MLQLKTILSSLENWFLLNSIKQNIALIIVNSIYFENRGCKINVSFLDSWTDKFKITEMLWLQTAKIYIYWRTKLDFVSYFRHGQVLDQDWVIAAAQDFGVPDGWTGEYRLFHHSFHQCWSCTYPFALGFQEERRQRGSGGDNCIGTHAWTWKLQHGNLR